MFDGTEAGCDTVRVTVNNVEPVVDEGIVNLNTWQQEAGGTGVWTVAVGGNSVFQEINTPEPTFFYSDFAALGSPLQGKIRVETVDDDDFIGFAIGFNPGDSSNTSADFLLVDWKQGNQNAFGGNAPSGLSVSRVTGVGNTTNFWAHTGPVEELARGNTLGSTGWGDNQTNEFQFEFTPTNLKVFVNGTLELNIAPTGPNFSDGRFAFYNFSQGAVRYSAVQSDSIAGDEGSPVTVEKDFSDVGVLDTHTASIDWGDGDVTSATVSEASGSGTATGTHVYADNGTYTVTVTVCDEIPACDSDDLTANIGNVDPSVSAGPDATVNEGTLLSFDLDGTCSGVQYNPANGHLYLAVSTTGNITWDQASAAVQSQTCGGLLGHLATVTSLQETNFIVANMSTAASGRYYIGGFQPAPFEEPGTDTSPASGWQWVTGEPFTYTNWGAGEPNDSGGIEDKLHLWTNPSLGKWNDIGPANAFSAGYIVEFEPAFTDPGADTWTGTVDYGDGTGVQTLTLNGKTFDLSHTYGHASPAGNPFVVTVEITDDDGGIGSDTLLVTVANVAPTITGISASPSSIDEAQSTTITATFTDPSWNDTHAATVDCGDGTLISSTLTEENTEPDSTGTVTAVCKYDDDDPTNTLSDTQTVTITVTDDFNDSDSASVNVTVNNVAPTVDAGQDVTVNEGSEAFGSVGFEFELVYSLDIPDNANYENGTPAYTVDNSASVGSFNRVAYRLTLQQGTGPTQTVWVAMDAFTTNASQLGVPVASTGATFQQTVTNMDVVSNVPGVVNGTGIATGNIEFWHNCYAKASGLGGLGAADGAYDYDDSRTTASCYSSIQVHNYGANQTIFAFNAWDMGGLDEVGIGNSSVGHPDWTFRHNAPSFAVRRLEVFVNSGSGGDGSFTDQGDDSWTGEVDYGDGTGVQSLPLNGTAFDLSHTYGHASPIGSPYVVTVTVTDDDKGPGTDTLLVTVDNIAPTITSISASANSIDEGQSTTITAAFTDPSWLDTHTSTVNCDGGTLISNTLTEERVAPDSTGTVVAVCAYPDDDPANTLSDTQTVTITVTDDFNDSDSDSVDVTVNNVAPTLTNTSITSPIDENQSATLTGTVTDPGTDDTFTLVVDWDDGNVETFYLPASSAGTQTFSVQHQYPDDDPTGTPSDDYVVTFVSLTDDDGGEAGTEVGGNIFLTGHDPDFHAQGNAGAKKLLLEGVEYARNGNSLPMLWVESRLPVLSGHRLGRDGLIVSGVGLVEGVDFIWKDAAQLASVNWSTLSTTYSAIGVASDHGGTLSDAEKDVLIAHKADIAAFINSGGGLLALSECSCHGYSNGGDPAKNFAFLPIAVTATGNAAPPYVVTTFGFDEFGLVAGDVNSPSHSHFDDDFGLNVVSFSSPTDQIMTLAGNVRIDDDTISQGLLVTVNNVAPSNVTASVSPSTIDEDDSTTLSGGFTDPGTLDTHKVVIDWGDGSANTTLNLAANVLTYSANHQYLDDNPTNTVSDDYSISVTVTDDDTGVDTAGTTVTVDNVAPIVNATGGTINEGQSSTVSATFNDQGAQDTHTAAIDWGDGDSESVTVSQGAGSGSLSASHVYGDNGTYSVTVTVTDDDTESGHYLTHVVVSNLDPTLVFDTSTAITFVSGNAAFMGRKDLEQTHSADASDPGSYDLTFDWGFAPDPTAASNVYYNNGISAEPPEPPTRTPDGVFPYSVFGDNASVTFGAPGVYTVDVTVTDDDGGSDSDDLDKLVTDNCDCARSQGYWKHQFKASVEGKGKQHIDDTTLEAYLDIIRFASGIFDEDIALTTLVDAHLVMDPPKGTGADPAQRREKATTQALAAWLNFAYGAVDWDEMIDTDGDGTPDSAFGDLITEVEAILSDPNATNDDLERAKDLAEAVNLHDKGNPDCDTESLTATEDEGPPETDPKPVAGKGNSNGNKR